MKYFLLTLLLIGCKSYKGDMVLHDHLIYKNTKKETQVLVLGEYDLKIKFRGKKKMIITAENMFEKAKIPVILKGEFNNTYPTSFNLPKGQNGQPFDVNGTIDQETIEGEAISETLTCSDSPLWERDCRWQYEDRPINYSGPYSYCNGLPRGEREVVYQINTIRTTLNFSFSEEGTPLANLNAQSEKDEKVYLEYGKCEM